MLQMLGANQSQVNPRQTSWRSSRDLDLTCHVPYFEPAMFGCPTPERQSPTPHPRQTLSAPV